MNIRFKYGGGYGGGHGYDGRYGYESRPVHEKCLYQKLFDMILGDGGIFGKGNKN